MMGPISGLESFERGRDRNIRRSAMLQGIRMQNEQLEMRKAAVEKADAQQAANYLAAEFGGGGYEGALYGAGSRGRRRGRSAAGTQGLGVDPATNIEAIRAIEDEAAKAAVVESREIEALQMQIAKQQAEQFRLQDRARSERQAIAPPPKPRVLAGDAIVAAEAQRKKEALTKQRLSNIAELLQGTPPVATTGVPQAEVRGLGWMERPVSGAGRPFEGVVEEVPVAEVEQRPIAAAIAKKLGIKWPPASEARQYHGGRRNPVEDARRKEQLLNKLRQGIRLGAEEYRALEKLATNEEFYEAQAAGDQSPEAQLAHVRETLVEPAVPPVLGDVTAEEIDQFAGERGINPLRLARGLAASGMYPGTALTSHGDPRLLKAIEEFKRRQALAPGRPKDISEPEWQGIKKSRAGYSKYASLEGRRGVVGGRPGSPGTDPQFSPRSGGLYWNERGQLVGQPGGEGSASVPFDERPAIYDPGERRPVPRDPRYKTEDAGIAGETRQWRADQLKSFSEEQILAFGGQKRVHKGETTYWLPESLTPLLEKGGPVDDTGGQAGVGSLAALNERLRTSRGKASDLRLSVRKLKRSKAGSALKNPFEEFGKPSTFMPSIQTVSYAVDMARGGRPGGTDLIAQMIGRVPYPSEIRRLNELVSDYQDFAGGVSAKRTEITRGRVKTAQDAADEQKFTQQRRFSAMTRDLLAGSIMDASPEFLDFASDNLGTLWGEYPEDAQKLLTKYVNMGEAERERFVEAQKLRRKGEGKKKDTGWAGLTAANMRTAMDAAGSGMETQQARATTIRNDLLKGGIMGGLGDVLKDPGGETSDIFTLPDLDENATGSQRARHKKSQEALDDVKEMYEINRGEKSLWKTRLEGFIADIPQGDVRARVGLSTILSPEANAYVTEKDLRWDEAKRGWRRWDRKRGKKGDWDARDRLYTADEIEGHVEAIARQSGR